MMSPPEHPADTAPRRRVLLVCALALGLLVAAAAHGAREFRERSGPGPRLFRLPVENQEGRLFSKNRLDRSLSLLGPDHRPQPEREDICARATCRDYKGRPFPYCYGNHTGTDFILKGGFKAMDHNLGRVVAAADGVVVAVEDGNYDRCRASVLTMKITCRGHEKKSNLVLIRHEGGYQSVYYHFQKDSILVRPGDRVKCGDFLGLVGSSGNSSMPHLHFEVIDPQGAALDPFSPDPADSMWVEQDGPYGLPAERCAGGDANAEAGT